MPATNPRLNMVLEKPLYQMIVKMARKGGVSISAKARDLLLQAIELEEDQMFANVVSSRLTDKRASVSHEAMWAHLK